MLVKDEQKVIVCDYCTKPIEDKIYIFSRLNLCSKCFKYYRERLKENGK